MAKRIGKHLLRSPKAIADEILRRTVGAIVTRVNEFTDVFADADGDTNKFLRSDMQWVNPRVRTETRIVAPSAFNPQTVGSWTHPAGAGGDFWTSAATTTLVAPLPIKTNERLKGVGLAFYRGAATNPTIRVLAATLAASATVITPTVAWTTPSATTTWEILEASYDSAAVLNHWSLDILAHSADRIRAAYVTVEIED